MFTSKAAIIGAGMMGPTHVEALRRNGITVTGIAGIDESESQKAAKELNLAKAYSSFEEVLSDSDVNVVHITTPNKFHFEMARDALNAGKHVLCEKPLAMNSKESAGLVELAKKTATVAAVNYNLRFYPLVMEAKDFIQRGDLGDIFSITGSYVQDWLLYDTDYNWRIKADEGGALRAVSDIGTHLLDAIRHMTGLEVQSLCADLHIVHKNRKRPKGEVQTFVSKVDKTLNPTEDLKVDTEDQAAILVRFNNGVRGVLWISQTTAGRKNSFKFEISGSKSALAWDSEQPCELWVGHRDKANEIIRKDPGILSESAQACNTFPGGHIEGYPDTFKMHFKQLYNYIEDGDYGKPAPFPTFEDGHHEIVVCEAILESSKKGGWVSL